MIAFLPAVGILALGASTAEVPDCVVGDVQCLEKMPVLSCSDEDSASVERCRISMERLERKSDAGWRDATRMLALAYRARSDRAKATATAARGDRQQSIALYRGLIESDAADAESVYGLAAAVEDPAERIRLLRRYVELSPDAVYGRRFLAHALHEEGKGNAEASLEAARLMEDAYALEPGAHKWWLARTAMYYYEGAGKPELAAALKARVLRELDVEDLADAAVASDPARAGRVLSTACNSLLAEATGPDACLESLDHVDRFLASAPRDANARQLADTAAGAMVELARAESALCRNLVGRLDRLAARGFDSPAIRESRALIATLEGTITVE